jgi:hypothetical protein
MVYAWRLFSMIEELKVVASFTTPIIVGYIGWLVNTRLKDIDHKRALELEESRQHYQEEKEQRKEKLERTYEEIVEFDIDGSFYGPQNQNFILCLELILKNKGKVIKRLRSLEVRIRAIRHDEELSYFSETDRRLKFPHKLTDGNILPKDWVYSFVEPGVIQKYSYTTKVGTEYSFVVVNAKFKYDDKGEHSVEKVLELPSKKATGRDLS